MVPYLCYYCWFAGFYVLIGYVRLGISMYVFFVFLRISVP